MPLRDHIQRFLDDVDPKISARGLDYYRRGMVRRLRRDGNLVTAEVSGSEADPYLVEFELGEDGEVADWSCGCPYDWGPVCKHIVAALLALQEAEEAEDDAERTAALQALAERAGREQLAALVLEHCRVDQRFRIQVLSRLETAGEMELDSIQALVRGTIRANTRRGRVDEMGCANICADLDDALDKARGRIQRGQWGRALELARFVLLTGMQLAEEAGSASAPLSRTIDAALEAAGLAAAGLAESGDDRAEWVSRLLETAREPVFDNWRNWRYDLLRRTTVLADEHSEEAFYDTLAHLSDRRWEAFQDGPRYDDQDRLIRYCVIRRAHGAEAARAYLKRNLTVDEFRLILIREYMEEGDFAAAEGLCRERAEREAVEERWPGRWQYLLYEICRDWGRRDKQIQQARRLALMGDPDYYQVTKDLLTEDGRWAEEYPEFLAQLKAGWPARKYMEILAQENEAALLMEQVRLCRDEVFRYGGVLAPRYGEEVRALCAGEIREASRQMRGLRDYRRTCNLLRMLADFGGAAEARALMDELRQTYSHRPALWEELEKVERRLQEKTGDL